MSWTLKNEQLEDMEAEENENFLPEEYALNADKRKLVLEITRKVCTDVQYQTILLYYFSELSIAEIAEIMECLEGTVKNRLSVARQKIKEGVLRYEKKSGRAKRVRSSPPVPDLESESNLLQVLNGENGIHCVEHHIVALHSFNGSLFISS